MANRPDTDLELHEHAESQDSAHGHGHAHDHNPYQQHHFDDMEQQKEATDFGMWIFLVQEVMFFGGLFVAYLVYRNKFFDAFGAASSTLRIDLGTVNTLVLIASSLTMAMAVNSAQLGKRLRLMFFLVATLALGSTFLGVKVIEYSEKFEKREVPGTNFCFEPQGAPCKTVSEVKEDTPHLIQRYLTGGWGHPQEGEAEPRPATDATNGEGKSALEPQAVGSGEGQEANPSGGDSLIVGASERQRSLPGAEIYFGLYFAMTGMHALHMIIGAGVLLWILWNSYKGMYSPAYYTDVENFGLYWHFVDIIWIYLFPLLYLINRHLGHH